MLGALPARVDRDLRRPGPLLRRGARQRRRRAAGDDEVVRHQLPLHRPGDRPATEFALNPDKVLSELKEALAHGIPARPVVIGPGHLPAAEQGASTARRRSDRAPARSWCRSTPSCCRCWPTPARSGCSSTSRRWSTDISARRARARRGASTTRWATLTNRPAIFVATYFGDPGAALPALARTPIEAIGVDLVYGADTAVAAVPELADKTLVAGVVDGRNIWRTDLEAALGKLATLLGSAAHGRRLDVVLDPARAVLAGARDRPGRRAAQLAGVRRREGARGRHPGRARCTTAARPSPTRSRRPTPPSPPARRTRACTTARSAPASTRSSPSGAHRGDAAQRRGQPGRAAAPAAAADHDDRVVPADRRDPQGPRRAASPARSTRPSTTAG